MTILRRARHARRRPRRSWPQRLILVFGLLAVIASSAAAAGLAWGIWQLEQIDRFEVELPAVADGEPENYLIVGSDKRSVEDEVAADVTGQRSDSIVIARIDPHEESVAVLSLPRDLLVEIAGTGERTRINAAFNQGRQVLADTIQENFDIPINHYVEVDFTGFEAVVGAIDGVPMWFDTTVRDRHSGLVETGPGCVTLDGDQALAFARSRYLEYQVEGEWEVDGSADLGRVSRQQLLIRRSIGQAVDSGLSDPATLTRLVQVGIDHVRVDQGISSRDLLALGRRFADFEAEALQTVTLPVKDALLDDGAQVLRVIEGDTTQFILSAFRDVASGFITQADVAVQVLNGSGVSNQAGDVAAALGRTGFGIVGTGDAVAPLERTQVHHGTMARAEADLVARHLTAGAELVEDPDLEDDQVILVTGSDFTTVQAAPLETIAGEAGQGDGGGGDAPTTSAPVPTTEPVGFRPPGDPPPGESCD